VVRESCRGARRNFQRNSILVTDAFLLGVRDYSSVRKCAAIIKK
jgi:hypothetical protein